LKIVLHKRKIELQKLENKSPETGKNKNNSEIIPLQKIFALEIVMLFKLILVLQINHFLLTRYY